MKKITVSIGIPAYNEEKNIKKLLTALFLQKISNFVLDNIYIVSDASTDKTEDIVSAFTDKRIILLRNPKRVGQSESQNAIFRKCKSQYLVLLEADTLPKSNSYLENLLDPVIKDSNIKLVQGISKCIPSSSFFGKAFYCHSTILCDLHLKSEKKRDAFCTGRGGRAVAKIIYRSCKIPRNVPEDAYMFFWSRKKGFKTIIADNAVMYFQYPQCLSDYVAAEQKIHAGKKALENTFDNSDISDHYKKGITLSLRYIIRFSITQPFYFALYIFLRIASYVRVRKNSFSDFWQIGTTTKSLAGVRSKNI